MAGFGTGCATGFGSEVGAGLPAEVRAALERGAVVVTANERGARTLRRAYDREIAQSGAERWRPAEVLSWAAWTAGLWRGMVMEGVGTSLLLNRTQEHAVWREVVAGDAALRSLRGVDGLADMAVEAWARVCAHGAQGSRTRLEGWGGSVDAEAFARWAGTFRERCDREGLLTRAELDGALAEAVAAGDLRVGFGEVCLVGFDARTRAQEGMLGALRGVGVGVRDAEVGVEETVGVVARAEEREAELRGCARWAKAMVERGGTVAIVVPDVAAERAGLERVLREVVAPQMEDVRRGEEERGVFEFSLGRGLMEAPGVRAAMETLRWVEGAMELETVSALVMSPYFAGVGTEWAKEQAARAEMDAYGLRQRGKLRPEMTVAEARARMGRWGAEARGLAEGLRGLERTAKGMGSEGDERSHGDWAKAMRGVLEAAKWGAPGLETSVEFQARERWESALDEVATLDFRGARVTYGQALRALERVVRETVFAPESREARVQVMGPMEAAGSRFDGMWFLRAGEMSWPVKAAVSSLLPWALQRESGMPGADAEGDAERANRVTERLAGSGVEVVWSYAERTEEGGKQRLAAVVRELGLEEMRVEEVAPEVRAREVVPMERVEDTGELPELPDQVLGGGARVLELQAACGFRAFAEMRLGSTVVEERELGMDAMERGNAVHEALRAFWDEVKTQGRLRAMTEEERGAVLARAVDGALAKVQRRAESAWDRAYVGSQRRRLMRLLRAWMEVEAARPPFEVVATERAFEDVRVGPLRLKLRMDRVDRVDGMELLIDYKTGAAEARAWQGERPDLPQVPLYALVAMGEGAAEEMGAQGELWADPGETGQVPFAFPAGSGEGGLGAVAFANVRLGKKMNMRGLAAREGLLPGKPGRFEPGVVGFEDQVERWRAVLTELAEQFARGDARVRPKNYPVTCAHCEQRLLCRLDASLLEEMEEEDENGGDENG